MASVFSEIMSNVEREFILKALSLKLRSDGRGLNEQRRLMLQVHRSPAKSRSEVVLGRTRVLTVVSAEVVPPFPDHPTEGFLAINVEFSPMASEAFEVGRPSEESIELRLLLERGLKDGNSIDLEALCIVAGESVWSIRADVRVLDHGGNITDAAALSVVAALLHFRRPQCTVGSVGSGQVTVHSDQERVPVPLSIHHIPICISFAVCCASSQVEAKTASEGGVDSQDPAGGLDAILLLDPSQREELVAVGTLTLALNSHGELCTVQKNGGAAVSVEQLLQSVRVSTLQVKSVMEVLKQALAEGDKRAEQKRLSYRPSHVSELPESSPFSATAPPTTLN